MRKHYLAVALAVAVQPRHPFVNDLEAGTFEDKRKAGAFSKMLDGAMGVFTGGEGDAYDVTELRGAALGGALVGMHFGVTATRTAIKNNQSKVYGIWNAKVR